MLTLDDIVVEIMRMLARHGLNCSRYAPPALPRIECKIPDKRKLIIHVYIVEEVAADG